MTLKWRIVVCLFQTCPTLTAASAQLCMAEVWVYVGSTAAGTCQNKAQHSQRSYQGCCFASSISVFGIFLPSKDFAACTQIIEYIKWEQSSPLLFNKFYCV